MDAPHDAIVVGSGATGGWAAKELTEAGLSVALLEAGPALPFDESLREVDAPSEPPPPPSQSIQASLSQGGHGAAMCQTVCRVETSYCPFTASGSFQIRLIMVGTT